MNRREFLCRSALAGAGALVSGWATASVPAPARAGDFAWGVLLHLGFNMWDDWSPSGTYPTSPEEDLKMFPTVEKRKNGSVKGHYRDYMAADIPLWKDVTTEMSAQKLNLVLIDVGEAFAYPSHPELWVKGSWNPDQMRAELRRLRSLGLEPIPKLNFSTGHDIWLKQYHYMTSTKKYYGVVADVIRDVCEVFETPRYFHLGFDEETPAAVKNRQMAVLRQGDLWWHDLEFCIREVECHGSRAMIWSDNVCAGKDAYLKRMSKGVLQVPWYYGTDFTKKRTTWDPAFEKKTDWSVQRNLAASIGVLADAGFDVLPCTSNWSSDAASEAMLAYCKGRVDPKRLKGFITAPWFMTIPQQREKLMDSVRIFAAAKRKVYPA